MKNATKKSKMRQAKTFLQNFNETNVEKMTLDSFWKASFWNRNEISFEIHIFAQTPVKSWAFS